MFFDANPLANWRNCWSDLGKAFKTIFVTQIVLTIFVYFLPLTTSFHFPLIVDFVVEHLQLWRLFTSFMPPSFGPFAILKVLFHCYILHQCLSEIEQKYSTAYSMIEVLLQTILCNVCLIIIGYPLTKLGIGINVTYLGYGILPAVLTLIWHRVQVDPEQLTRFCCTPCFTYAKMIPLFYLLLLCLIEIPVPLCIYFFLGCFQFWYLKKSILRLPLAIYKLFDVLTPDFIANDTGYIKVATVEANLRMVCWKGCNDQNEENNALNEEKREHDGSSPERPKASDLKLEKNSSHLDMHQLPKYNSGYLQQS